LISRKEMRGEPGGGHGAARSRATRDADIWCAERIEAQDVQNPNKRTQTLRISALFRLQSLW
jgi:hypothetical protein